MSMEKALPQMEQKVLHTSAHYNNVKEEVLQSNYFGLASFLAAGYFKSIKTQ